MAMAMAMAKGSCPTGRPAYSDERELDKNVKVPPPRIRVVKVPTFKIGRVVVSAEQIILWRSCST